MREYTYHREIRTLLAQVLNALDHLVIKRLDELDETTNTDNIAVSLMYSPKQRVLFDIVNKSQHIKVPCMALTMSSIAYDPKRAFNKIEGFTVAPIYKPDGGDFPQPVPVDITLNLSILARYQRDIDQILTCIFANFFPYIILSYEHPDLKHEVRCKLEWNKTINLQYPNDITANTSYRLIADTTFTLQGWIYRNAYNDSGIIHNIPISFTAVSALYDDYDAMKSLEAPEMTDYLTVSGKPYLKDVTPYQVTINDTGKTLLIKGNMFDYLSGVCLSGLSPDVFPLTTYQNFDLFTDSHRLSSVYPAFDAVSVRYIKMDNNTLILTIPKIENSGYFEIMGYGLAGIGKLTEDSTRTTLNPYATGSPEYNNFTPMQFPYVSGVHIF